jgi:pimeloyl-ACP methyl ester carboxylesterase
MVMAVAVPLDCHGQLQALVLAWVVTIVTMLRPEVRYARADDGVAIAYSVVGDGPVTIVVVSPLISQLELAWEEPALEHFWSRFAACARVVLFDRRGAGLSDRSPAGERVDLAALASDILAVLGACDAGQAVLFGVTFGCPVALGFAASYPERVEALVLAGGFAKLTRLGEFDFEADPGLVDEWARSTARAWGSGAVLGARAPSMRDSARYREWAARMERHTCSPGSVEALCRWAAGIDARPLLASLRVPVLVIHRQGDRAVPASDGRYLAEHIPGAEYAELPGTTTPCSPVTSGPCTGPSSGSSTVRSPAARCGQRCAAPTGRTRPGPAGMP